ncbi:hypothetical protein M9H77_31737 [Catharanthus roseus]|uniref:Uncharacterized protein n=1 Tax=Catharanthus roseus TaxID=4058 RepID=A0ACC0A0W3_CATRO|nr:hypothetical protein M9H77_31737 [Catharanthus roseus]
MTNNFRAAGDHLASDLLQLLTPPGATFRLTMPATIPKRTITEALKILIGAASVPDYLCGCNFWLENFLNH